MISKLNISKACLLIVLSIMILAVTGCTYRIMADYDRIIDKTALSVQSKIETFLNKMERCAGTPEGEYVNNIQFYDEMKGTLDSLSIRAATIPLHEKVLEQINLLKASIEKLRSLHECQPCNGLTKETISPIRADLNAIFASIYTSENALKRSAKVSTITK